MAPNKHTSAGERMYKGHLLESETYIGGKVEAIESGECWCGVVAPHRTVSTPCVSSYCLTRTYPPCCPLAPPPPLSTLQASSAATCPRASAARQRGTRWVQRGGACMYEGGNSAD